VLVLPLETQKESPSEALSELHGGIRKNNVRVKLKVSFENVKRVNKRFWLAENKNKIVKKAFSLPQGERERERDGR
jgi:hypothetical protein